MSAAPVRPSSRGETFLHYMQAQFPDAGITSIEELNGGLMISRGSENGVFIDADGSIWCEREGELQAAVRPADDFEIALYEVNPGSSRGSEILGEFRRRFERAPWASCETLLVVD